MRIPSAVATTIAAVLSSASALSILETQANDFPPMQITSLVLKSISNGNTTIKFQVLDPSPLTNTSTSCSGAWSTNAGPAVGQYTLCTNQDFEWTFNSYESTQSFELAPAHSFEDNNVGEPPYNYVTTFAQVAVNSTNLRCLPAYGQTTCSQPKKTRIYAPIYALTS